MPVPEGTPGMLEVEPRTITLPSSSQLVDGETATERARLIHHCRKAVRWTAPRTGRSRLTISIAAKLMTPQSSANASRSRDWPGEFAR